MAFVYNKLKGRIKEMCGTQNKFAELLGVSRASVSTKLNNGVEFSQREIMIAIEILEIDPADIPAYFFTQEVQKTEQ